MVHTENGGISWYPQTTEGCHGTHRERRDIMVPTDNRGVMVHNGLYILRKLKKKGNENRHVCILSKFHNSLM